MSLEPQSVPEETLGSLQSCLVDGNLQQRKRERRVRRRALIISVVLQTAILGALVLLPLFGKPAPISSIVIPVPTYRSAGAPHPVKNTMRANAVRVCYVCFNSRPTNLDQVTRRTPDETHEGPINIGEGPVGSCPTCINIAGSTPAPLPPPPVHQDKPRTAYITHIDPARLTHRVEPVYPMLARQTGRSGRVELHAIIATDGTIKSLQVVSGDPPFYRSAMEAVLEWRYTPTVLNGQPVEVDTFITVIYNINR